MRFKRRKRKYTIWNGDKYEDEEIQCPVCKEWFNNNFKDGRNLRLHIVKMAKSEAFKNCLGDIKSLKHFNLYKKITMYNPVNNKRIFIE